MNQHWRMSAGETAQRVTRGELSAQDVTAASLQRLAQVNPGINAVVQEMPDAAMAAAEAVDNAVACGQDPGPLAGVPVTIKVNVDQQGFATTNGIRIQQNHLAEQDNPVVANLRRAGAIIVGRSNTPAFSMRWFTRNSLHGHTLNPRNRTLTPGGSSGGAAAAVAAGICAIGHGTDIAGSIRYPAYACGLHGIRPTLGRVPAVNLSLPDRHIGAQLTAVSGPIARSIKDLRLALEVMAATSSLDPWWVPAPIENIDAPTRVALCVAPEGLEVDDRVEAAIREAGRQLDDAGWEVVEVDCPPLREPARLQLLLWLSEFHLNHGAAVVEENDPDANFVYARLRDLTVEPTLESFMQALQRRVTLAREWQQFLTDYPLLLCPVSALPPFPDQLDVASPEDFDRVIEAQLTQIALPFFGLPGLSVATEPNHRVPMGVQLVAGRFCEGHLFAAATDIEARNPALEIADPD